MTLPDLTGPPDPDRPRRQADPRDPRLSYCSTPVARQKETTRAMRVVYAAERDRHAWITRTAPDVADGQLPIEGAQPGPGGPPSDGTSGIGAGAERATTSPASAPGRRDARGRDGRASRLRGRPGARGAPPSPDLAAGDCRAPPAIRRRSPPRPAGRRFPSGPVASVQGFGPYCPGLTSEAGVEPDVDQPRHPARPPGPRQAFGTDRRRPGVVAHEPERRRGSRRIVFHPRISSPLPFVSSRLVAKLKSPLARRTAVPLRRRMQAGRIRRGRRRYRGGPPWTATGTRCEPAAALNGGVIPQDGRPGRGASTPARGSPVQEIGIASRCAARKPAAEGRSSG